jgi:hypothetical protein
MQPATTCDLAMTPAVTLHRPRRGLIAQIRLVFRSIATGGAMLPLEDNRELLQLLAGYAAALREPAERPRS